MSREMLLYEIGELLNILRELINGSVESEEAEEANGGRDADVGDCAEQ